MRHRWKTGRRSMINRGRTSANQSASPSSKGNRWVLDSSNQRDRSLFQTIGSEARHPSFRKVANFLPSSYPTKEDRKDNSYCGMITFKERPVESEAPKEKILLEEMDGRKGDPVRVKRDYFSRDASEMSVFYDDEHLELLDDSNQNWWLLKDMKSGQVGYVPANLVQSTDEVLAAANAFQNLSINVKPLDGVGKKRIELNKRVSFSETGPTEHIVERIEYEEDEELWPINDPEGDLDSEDEEEDNDTFQASSFLQNALIDEAVRKALGIDESPKLDLNAPFIHVESARKAEEARLLPSDDYVAAEERLELPQKTQTAKPSLFTRLVSPLLRSQSTNPNDSTNGMVKVFAGNFSPIETYKTCIMDDNASLLELESVAKKLYQIDEDEVGEDDFELTMVHSKTHHVLPVTSTLSLGTLTEIAKIATIEDGHLQDAKGKPVSRHRKKVPRSHLIVIRKRKQNISLKGIKEGFRQDPHLTRHRNSDFPTNYRFVLNMKIAPYIRRNFYIWIELESSNKEQQALSRIALAVKALTTVDEIIKRSLASMEVAKMSGVSYDLVLSLQSSHIHQFYFEATDGREVLSREMTINDIHNQWSHIDSSGFLFLLRPFVSTGMTSSDSLVPH